MYVFISYSSKFVRVHYCYIAACNGKDDGAGPGAYYQFHIAADPVCARQGRESHRGRPSK